MEQEVQQSMIEVDGVMVPKRIGHDYEPVKVYPLSYLQEAKVLSHRRLTVFRHKGLKCAFPECEREGHYIIVGKDASGHRHIDLYTKDFILMTVDHIYPRSAGGQNSLINMQPMCELCNTKKGAQIITFCVNTRAPILLTI